MKEQAEERAMESRGALIFMEDIWKRFGAVEALRGVDFEVMHGEVVGLVGDNGAGKSTLMKILTGVYAPDRGRIYVEGKLVSFKSPEDSRRLGIEMIYQDLALAKKQDVASNIFLGREPLRAYLGGLVKIIDRAKMREAAQRLLDQLRIRIDSVDQRVFTLSGGQQQAVAIARAFSSTIQPKLIIMDEPTAALAVKEVEKVLQLIEQLKRQHISVIFISHRLPHIFQVCDRVVVLRGGKKVGDKPIHETNMDEVVKLIIGG
jgi:simple sugar transport system ATP-binding protein